MLPPDRTHALARGLVACEAEAGSAPLHTEPATLRVYEKLRRQLGAAVGSDGFQTLASRALALAKSQSPGLSAVQVTPNGVLHGFRSVESQPDTAENDDAGVTLIAQLLGLFLTFLGEATTLRLIEDLRLQVDTGKTAVVTPAEIKLPAAGGPQRTFAFEELLLEIDRLRVMSERIEILADKHPGMEDGLVCVAGNIRSIATVLDVFALIRSNAGGPNEDEPDLERNRFMN